MKTYLIPDENFGKFTVRFQKLYKRAQKIAKKGYADAESLSYKANEVWHDVDPRSLYAERHPSVVRRKMWEVTVTGNAPCIGGFEFLCTINHTEAGNLMRIVPTAVVEDGLFVPYRTAESKCEHCNKVRTRSDTFLIRQIESGKIFQIGRNCLADFLNTVSPDAVAEWAELISTDLSDLEEEPDDDDEYSRGGRSEYFIEPLWYLTAVAAVIREHGWVSNTTAKNHEGMQSTSSVAMELAYPPTPAPWNYVAPATMTDEDRQMAEKVLAYAHEQLANADIHGMSDYEYNLRVVSLMNMWSWKNIGLGASLVSWYQRKMGIMQEYEKSQRETKNSVYLGEIGKRQEFANLTVKHVIEFPTEYGVTKIHTFVDPSNNVLVWFASNQRLDEGSTVTLTATVKAHNERKGIKQTILTRCKV